MALAIREQQQSTFANTDFVFTLGAGTQVGDLVVVIQANSFYTAANLTTPTGTAVASWTLRNTMDGGTNDSHAKVWTGTVTTGGAQTVDTNWTTTDEERFVTVFVISGGAAYADAQSADTDTTSTNYVAPSVTPAAGSTDNILMCLWGFTSGGTIDLTPPGGMTGYTEVDFTAFNTYRAASEVYTSSSATGTRTATGTAARDGFGVSVIVSATTARQSVALTHVGSSTWVAPASSAAVAPTYPSGLADATATQTDVVYAVLHIKPDTATVATPANWALVTSASGGSGTQGAGAGATRVHLYRRTATAALSGTTQSFTITGGSSPVAFMRAYRASGTNVSFDAETTTSWSVTTASTTIGGTAGAGLTLAALDAIGCVVGTPDDQSTTLTLTGLTATGATLGALTQDPAATVVNAQGNDISATAYRIAVTAGTSSSAPVATATSSSSETAMGFLWRVRATADVPATSLVFPRRPTCGLLLR